MADKPDDTEDLKWMCCRMPGLAWIRPVNGRLIFAEREDGDLGFI